MRKQKYGRIVNTSSSSGLFGNFGQSNYAAAKMAVVGFTETLAKEGLKYNIVANTLAPGAASRLTATVFDQKMMEIMKPDWVVPLVGVLTHESNTKETGSIFEASSGHFSKIRWERSDGLVLRADEELTADVLLKNWAKVSDFSKVEYPNSGVNGLTKLEQGNKLPKNERHYDQPISFEGKVALVTGGGEGLGRAYAQHFAKLGAKVAVNDVEHAESVADGINKAGGQAFPIVQTVEKGDEVVKAVIEKYGRIDIVVNNAGILRDKAFTNMSDEQWHAVINVHLRGTYKVMKAAWPFMLKQKYGRIINITSTSGIYGSFGQANYAAAVSYIVAFEDVLLLILTEIGYRRPDNIDGERGPEVQYSRKCCCTSCRNKHDPNRKFRS
jgi:multifunctional beta-oxidation protein